MRLWVFSDLHFTNSSTDLYRSFLNALQEPEGPEDVVVFAGDIFDLMVGDSSLFYAKFQSFFEAVQLLSQRKVRLFYIEGNHDFHIQNLFRNTNIRFEEEAVTLASPHKKMFYIAHGDLVDKTDSRYLSLRQFFRSMPVRRLAGLVPGKIIESIGEAISRPLSQKAKDIPDYWPEDDQKKLRATFREFAEEKKCQGFDYIILGHCHDLDEQAPHYFNMGYPPIHRQFLFYDSTSDRVERRKFA